MKNRSITMRVCTVNCICNPHFTILPHTRDKKKIYEKMKKHVCIVRRNKTYVALIKILEIDC